MVVLGILAVLCAASSAELSVTQIQATDFPGVDLSASTTPTTRESDAALTQSSAAHVAVTDPLVPQARKAVDSGAPLVQSELANAAGADASLSPLPPASKSGARSKTPDIAAVDASPSPTPQAAVSSEALARSEAPDSAGANPSPSPVPKPAHSGAPLTQRPPAIRAASFLSPTSAPMRSPTPLPWEEKVGIAAAAVAGVATLAGAVADSVQPRQTDAPVMTTLTTTMPIPLKIAAAPATVARLYGDSNNKPIGSPPPRIVLQVAVVGASAVVLFACGLLCVGFIFYSSRKKRSGPIEIRACILQGEPEYAVWASAKAEGTEGWPLLA